MNLLIVDDEKLARERLKSLLTELAIQGEWLEAANGIEALQCCDQQRVDVLLLDIRMPAMDGIEVARHLASLPSPPAVIFTTAYDQHALAAFEHHAVDYLLKPVKKDRLQQALERARALTQGQLGGLQDTQPEKRRHLSATSQGQLKLMSIDEVCYFRADQKYVTACSANGSLLLEESLKSLEQEFSPDFLRIHRNTLVSVKCVEALEKDEHGGAMIRLRGIAEPLTVSRRHLSAVRQALR